MPVLLSGATGFVGRAVLARLLDEGREVRALVRDPGRLPAGLRERAQVHAGSLEDPASLRGAASGITAVVHVAGLVAARSPGELFAVNRDGTAALAAAVRQAAPRARWVQVSSLAAAGPGDPVRDGDPPAPVSDYGRSKLAGEQALARSGLEEWLVLRPCAVYGPGDTAFLPFFRGVRSGWPVPVLSRRQRLSFLHVEDLAGAISAALEAPRLHAGAVLHLAHPEAATLAGFLQALGEAVGRRPRILRVPAAVAWTLAAAVAPLRRLTGRPRFFSLDKLRELRAPAWCCDPAGAAAALGWTAGLALDRGLRQTAEHYRSEGLLAPLPPGLRASERPTAPRA